MSIEEYRKLQVDDIKNNYLSDIRYIDDKNIELSDIIGLPNDFFAYLEEHEMLYRNVKLLLRKISEVFNSYKTKNLNSQIKVNNWYIEVSVDIENWYRLFVNECCGKYITDNELEKISKMKSVKDVILTVYECLCDNEIRKTSVR